MSRHVEVCPYCGGPDYAPHVRRDCTREQIARRERAIVEAALQVEEAQERVRKAVGELVALRATIARHATYGGTDG